MYPTLYHAFLDLFGIDWPWMKLLNSFGFFVALAFIAASITLSRELKRKEAIGVLRPEKRKLIIGEAPKWGEIAMNGVIGFIIGWKFIYLFVNSSRLFNGHESPQHHIFSSEGYWLMGLALGTGFAWWRYRDFKKNQLPVPEEKIVDFHKYEYTGTITFLAAIFGIAGAKLFHLFENPKEFIQFFTHPDLEGFLSGLTIYGGLIVGGGGVLLYAWRKNIPPLVLCDATTPGLMLAYGIGRIGCQVSGDGDWGVANLAAKPGWLSWLPDWIWAYDYPNNVNGVGEPLTNGIIFDGYGTHLVPPAFPTPFYETVMALIIFLVLWWLRKKIATAGIITALYLVLNGIERFFIEKIRVNHEIEWLGIKATQAEFISVLFVVAGVSMGLFLLLRKRETVGTT
ncbi:MAG: prolipoprotein diacylglyceryl transferase [Crocinitomicaceae bacterium]|nr:prolipoprotein diacylglyceryl transferase [Crocinitomicaceae bacterium]